MKLKHIEVGDKVLAKRCGGSCFTARIIGIKKGLFGKKYYAEWVIDSDLGGVYSYTGVLRSWNIIFF